MSTTAPATAKATATATACAAATGTASAAATGTATAAAAGAGTTAGIGPATGAAPASTAAVAFTGLAALAVAMGVGRFAFTPILPMMLNDAGLSIGEGGWLASANYAGYLVGALTAVRLRLSSVAAIRAGLVLISLATLAMGLHPGFAFWLGLRAVAGMASAWVLIFVSAWALGKQAHGGSVFAGVGAGITAAGGVCLALMAVPVTSADAWITFGVASLLVTAAVWHRFGGGPAPPASTGQTRPASRHWLLILCYGGFGFGYVVPATFLPAMARDAIADPLLFGLAWPVFGAAAAVSTVFAGSFSNQRKVWIAASLVMVLGVLLPLAVAGMTGIIIAAILVGGTFMVITMAGMQEARRVASDQARPLMAAMTAAFALGQIAGPLWVSCTGNVASSLLAAALVLSASAVALFHDGVRK